MMTQWKNIYERPFENTLYITFLVLMLFSFYATSLLLFLFALFCLTANLASGYYLKKITESVELKNPHQTVRLFTGDEDTISVRLENDGNLPLFNGKFQFIFDDCVECRELDVNYSGQVQKTYVFPVNIDRRTAYTAKIPVTGMKRGVAKMRGIHIVTKDWFGLGEVRMVHDLLFKTEVIVYPELKAVYGLERIRTTWQGERPVQFSLDEDVLAPTGTRDYSSSDPFNRIHWKASAKSGQLQTKVFEKTNGMTWVLILNVTREKGMEQEISSVAYICRYAVEHGIPFELYINIKTRGRGQIMHLNASDSREHLSKALEMLARINPQSVTVPPARLLAFVDRQRYQNPVMILSRLSYKDDGMGILTKWRKKGFSLHRIEHRDNGTYVTGLAREVS